MGNIATTDARGVFTKTLIDVYRERPEVMGFLRSFFPDDIKMTKELSIEVRRGFERTAVDVIRGSIGNRNIFSRSSEKIFIPPYHREYFDATDLNSYDLLFASTQIDAGAFTALLEEVSEKMGMLQDKIERAHELQCAEVLLTGIVSLNKGINIDFKRKAASLVDKGGGAYWATGTVDAVKDLEDGSRFIRSVGKGQGGNYNVIMGSTAYNDFVQNDTVKERADIRNFELDAIRAPQRNSVGGTLHGEVSGGAYKFRIWSYPEFHDDSSGTNIEYVDPKKVIIIPESPRFKFGFAGVPQLATVGGGVRKGKFIFGDYTDERKSTHDFDVKSAGLAIPVAVDQLYTVQVVA